MSVVRSFVPWYRAGLATALSAAPPAGAGRARVPAAVRLRGRADELALPVELAGPGDVVGLDHREILWTEPFDGAADFEPSYLPYVELASADLPWRFSPLAPTSHSLDDPEHAGERRTQQRLQPWLTLAVVPAGEATIRRAPPGGLPVLGCPAAQLPDPQEAWAWAHVQVTHDATVPLASAVTDPLRRVARVLSSRRLEAGVRYLACLVPTFAAGRLALLAGSPDAEPLGPAWGPAGDVELPVFFQWSFTTGEAGSFEALVGRLRPWPRPDAEPPAEVPADFGGRTIRTGEPGWGARADANGTALMLGALRPVGAGEPAPTDPGLAEALRAAVSRSGTGVELRPPIYGQDYQGGAAAVTGSGWLADLNTDPRRRLAAGLGAWAVVLNQEELADRAWRQLADADAGRRGEVELAQAVDASLADRHQLTAAALPAALVRLARSAGPLGTPGAPPPVAQPAAAPVPTARFAPSFDESAYTYLRAVAEEWLLPGAGDIPADSVVLVQTNGAFVESFLVGLNHALARELIWRRYPLDVGATFFDRFWAAPAGGTASTALPPVADWPAADRLGDHGPGPDQLVLLIRGALLRRFPTAAVYLSRTGADGAEERLLPQLSGTVGADIVFVGFPPTPQQALDGGWSIVVAEAVDRARFGLDEATEETGADPPASWQDLTWSHPQVAGRGHIPVAGPLAGVARPANGDGAAPSVVWGLDAGHLAVALQQPAFQVRIPIHLWVTPPVSTPPG